MPRAQLVSNLVVAAFGILTIANLDVSRIIAPTRF